MSKLSYMQSRSRVFFLLGQPLAGKTKVANHLRGLLNAAAVDIEGMMYLRCVASQRYADRISGIQDDFDAMQEEYDDLIMEELHELENAAYAGRGRTAVIAMPPDYFGGQEVSLIQVALFRVWEQYWPAVDPEFLWLRVRPSQMVKRYQEGKLVASLSGSKEKVYKERIRSDLEALSRHVKSMQERGESGDDLRANLFMTANDDVFARIAGITVDSTDVPTFSRRDGLLEAAEFASNLALYVEAKA